MIEQPDLIPALAEVGRLVDALSVKRIEGAVALAGARVNCARISGAVDCQRANGLGRLGVEGLMEVGAVVSADPNAARCCSGDDHAALVGCDRGDASGHD